MESTKNNLIEIIKTEDGSMSLLRKDIEESYHSCFGALSETNTIYVDYGYNYFCSLDSKPQINILEIGFGTGLNAIATLKNSNNRKIFYQTLELYPISLSVAEMLSYGKELLLEEEFIAMHKCEWNEIVDISSDFKIKKYETNACDYVLPEDFFDVVYFDAFSPEKDADLWSEDMMQKVYNACRKGAVLTTYCCKGEIKRRMKKVGFSITKLPGPKGKREILRAEKK
ncbi:MAG: tRNA (5-methylaminomethyl-2-thiouridine)(34)-methyltransferase MnmD [Bacteroidales bacterium]|nr:tRNA (5-methylaminomethyl-2-thiouridine)(34)-methyltransferase MnmD [Bacteroidales bacterium]